MTTFKLLVRLALAAASICASAQAAAGIPVLDTSNLAQQIQQVVSWARQAQDMASQLQKAQSQLEKAEANLSSITGGRGLGNILSNPLLQGVMPEDAATVLHAVSSGGFDSLTSAAKTLRNSGMIYNCADRTGEAFRVCQAILNISAQDQAYQQGALQVVTQRMRQIQSLQEAINTTTDPKGVAEIQARIQAETAQVGNDANRMAAARAVAEAQRYSAEQAVRERALKLLAPSAARSADTFTFVAP